MFRNTLKNLPESVKEDFIDSDPKCVEKVKTLKGMIKSKFPVSSKSSRLSVSSSVKLLD